MTVLWTPPADVRLRSEIGRYLLGLSTGRGLTFESYAELWRWSVTDLEGFWSSIWDHFRVIGHAPYDAVLGEATMPGAVWFGGATLNYAEHALRGDDAALAIISRSQTRAGEALTNATLRDQVARARAGLQ